MNQSHLFTGGGERRDPPFHLILRGCRQGFQPQCQLWGTRRSLGGSASAVSAPQNFSIPAFYFLGPPAPIQAQLDITRPFFWGGEVNGTKFPPHH